MFGEPSGTTPLSWEEQQALKPTWVTTRAELNEVEQQNILKAQPWARRNRRPERVSTANSRSPLVANESPHLA